MWRAGVVAPYVLFVGAGLPDGPKRKGGTSRTPSPTILTAAPSLFHNQTFTRHFNRFLIPHERKERGGEVG